MSRQTRSVSAALAGTLLVAGCTGEARSGTRSGEDTAATTPSTPAATSPGLLVPNLRSLGAHDLQIETYGSGRRAYFGDCTRDGPQGISPGWVDIYKADLDGQWLRLPPGHDRRLLCLDVTAGPLGLLLEVSEADNGTSVPLRVKGSNVRRVDTDRCD